MSFRSQFEGAQEKAYNRNIATKIFDGMSKLRASADESSTTSKRWIWELIQNAKDVSLGGNVKVLIEADLGGPNPHVTFRHNGSPFSAENIRFLIEQVSSKDRTNDEEGRPTTTGKFGTGFLTTHLLSERVVVRGIASEASFAPRKFKLLLDRSGSELEEIIEAVQSAKDSIVRLDEKPPYRDYAPDEFNTAFCYELTDKTGKDVARAGLADLETCLPYTLAFVREIESVESPGRLVKLKRRHDNWTEGGVRLLTIASVEPEAVEAQEVTRVAILRKGLTSIAVPIEVTSDGVRILPVGPNVPKLFCDFPLLGTETLPFPVVINNPTFNPTEPRDGVFLTRSERASSLADHNREIFKEAVSLYLLLLNHASENNWEDLHFLASFRSAPADLGWLDQNWYVSEILNPLRATLLTTKIVRTAGGTMAPIHSPAGKKYSWFPSNPNKEIRRRIWRSCKSWFPDRIPALSDVEAWHEVLWQDCGRLTLDQIASFIEQENTIEKLASELEGKEVQEWLMDLYATMKLDEPTFQAVVSKRRIFPNQNGTFKRKAELSRDAGDIDTVLLDILELLGIDLRDQLLDSSIKTDLDDLPSKDKAFVVKEINAAVEKHINDRTSTKRLRPAFSKLLLWFRENGSQARKLFPTLYDRKHLLYDDEEILNNIERAEELSELLNDYKVTNVAELRAVIESHTVASKVLPVTQKIIASLGITSVEQWIKALEDKNLAALFSHKSTPTPDMFVYAQTLISEAKEGVIAHLRTLNEYDLSEMDETAPTVLAGIKKDGRDMTIVVRPAYDGTVIIYYQSERDVLDFVDHELWVDTGTDVRRITFGHILKRSGIRRFPI